ncbi:MAG: hypothetical protein IJI92_01865 [Erysipelotrichaceae bacterium]|nr:hypothetical protein [Erysipelotrichaceae bacterium]
MIRLNGTLKERLDQAIRMSYTGVTSIEFNHFRHIYSTAGIRLLPSAEEFFKHYGGVFRNYYLVLSDPSYNDDFHFDFYADSTDPKEPEEEVLLRLDNAMRSKKKVKEFAQQKVCPVAKIGYFYPADVFVGENGLLYCVYGLHDEIDVFHTPNEILESSLKDNMPVGIELSSVITYRGE